MAISETRKNKDWGQATDWDWSFQFTSVLWYWWLGDRKGILAIKTWATYL